MNITTIIKKKIYYPYIALSFILFIILSTLNYFYKNNVLTLSLGNQYTVSATEYNSYKTKAHAAIFKYIFSNKIQTLHRVKNVRNTDQAIYFKKKLGEFNLTLILSDYVDEKKLENKINEEYTKRLKANLEILDESLFLYDYETLKKEYEKYRLSRIELAYNTLSNSEFAKKYPAQNCYDKKEFCLINSVEYYKYILKNINIDDKKNIQAFLGTSDDKNYSVSNIYKDFTLNRNKYDNQSLEELLYEPSKHIENFYRNKYINFKNSKFNYEYSLSLITNCDSTSPHEFFSCTSKALNELREIFKIEINFPFKIKYQAPLEKQSFHLLFETIKILIFTLLITYILFILTNKFLSRKL